MKNYNVKNNYNYNIINNTLTVTDEFMKRAGSLGSAEFKLVQEYRKNCPGVKIEKGKISAKRPVTEKKKYTYKEMEDFFRNYYGANGDNYDDCPEFTAFQEEFKKIKNLSKLDKSPYSVVSKWFERKIAPLQKEIAAYLEDTSTVEDISEVEDTSAVRETTTPDIVISAEEGKAKKIPA